MFLRDKISYWKANLKSLLNSLAIRETFFLCKVTVII